MASVISNFHVLDTNVLYLDNKFSDLSKLHPCLNTNILWYVRNIEDIMQVNAKQFRKRKHCYVLCKNALIYF